MITVHLRRTVASALAVLAMLGFGGACTRQADTPEPSATAATSEAQADTPSTATREGSPGDGVERGADSSPPAAADAVDPEWLEPLPLDPEVVKGTLDNGLTYYLMENDAPGGRAELRLAVDAGSVLESDDQLGMAHFLEHMMFNGTENFPRNELTAVLESFGPRFGPDINAYTSYDETVYQLSLPTDDDLLDLGVQVLGEWADRATITETDVIEERGVVLDEWRIRDQGLSGRLFDSLESLLLVGTSYEGRAPIGTGPLIESADAAVLREFYETWYRPDLMAVVAVGDFDLDDMEQRIVEEFGSLDRAGPDRPSFESAIADGGAVALADPEIVSGTLDVTWVAPVQGAPDSILDLRNDALQALALDMFATRLNDDALRGEIPLISASPDIGNFGRNLSIGGITATARVGDLEQGLAAVMEERARILEFGFGQAEFDQALGDLRSVSDQERNSASTRQDAELAAALVGHHLGGAPLMDPEDRYQVIREIYDGITSDDVDHHFRRAFMARPFVRALGSAEPAAPVPSEDALLAIIDRTDWAVEPREASNVRVETLMEPPEPAETLRVETDPNYGFQRLFLGNGTQVVLWPTSISENSVYLRATSWGGTSVLAVDDLIATEVLTQVVRNSGAGPVDPVALERFLTGRIAAIDVVLGETRDIISGASATEDLETLLQLLHLTMTAPRVDPVALSAAIDENRELYGSVDEIPQLAAFKAVQDAYYGDNPRYALPAPAEFDAVDDELVTSVLADRFGDAGDFIFVLVGDLDVDTASRLAAAYIGSLPGTGERERFVDNQPLPARQVQRIDLEIGDDPEGSLSMYFTNPYGYSLRDDLALDVLALILNARLRDRIREELGATYSPFTSIDLQREPDPYIEASVEVTGDPNDLARIADEIVAAIADLQANGPTGTEFDTAVEQLRTELELISNLELAEAVTTEWFYPDQPVANLSLRHDAVEEITSADVQRLSRVAYDLDQRIEVRLGPE